MKTGKLPLAARLFLGFILLVLGGLNGFFHFIPMPTPPEAAMDFFVAMGKTGYFLPFLAGTELVLGVMFLLNLFVPLALIVAAPIALQAFLFHLALDPAGIGGAAVMIVLELYLAWVYQDTFKAVLLMKTGAPKA
ncbi:MAG: DoxX family protein [SAR324 cluster bacterium]|nr:DoxX family protein [SAR324 cluster bacterium]